jgi:cysteinyl-tRNA synthetase
VAGGHQLRLYNSLGRRVEDFTPSGDVTGMYSCGPTVYAFPHLGNMRAWVFSDTVRRALRWKNVAVRHVINITDVGHAVADSDTGEDKLEVAAAREHRSVLDIAAFYTDIFFVDLAALNILPADEYPRASAYVPQMIEFAAELERKGFTYRLPSGLYFDTAKDPGYGLLAQMDAEGQLEAARVEHVEGRRRKTDFALWRAEEPGQRRVMRWDSPWGWGAPGWHLECSVMSMALLGPHFDIHTGGVDHRELHHVNEIAQSQAYLGDGKPWVRYWLHTEFLQLGARKMAKSAGGAPRLADLTEAGYHPMAYRLFLLGGHYRSQLDFTTAAVEAAQATLRRLVARIQPLRPLPAIETFAGAEERVKDDPAAERLLDTIDTAIAADLSTPRILAALQDALRDPAITPDGQRAVVAAADALLGLGLVTLEPEDLEHRRAPADLSPEERHAIEDLVADRTRARESRDWPRADQIRAELDELGVTLTDTPEGPTWHLR